MLYVVEVGFLDVVFQLYCNAGLELVVMVAINDDARLLTQTIAEPGFWAPLPALREGARGSWSVMAIEATPEGDRSVPAAVEVIHSDGTQVFLRGTLPPGARIVAQAPDRVAPGQVVLAQGN